MIDNKENILATILLFNSFIWYYLTLSSIKTSLLLTSYHLGIIVFVMFGAILSKITHRVRFIYLWMVLGTIISLLPSFINNDTESILIYFVLGASLGIGMPSCLAYFADYTSVEKRGRISGVIFFVTNLSVFVLFLSNLPINFFFLFIWRIFGLVILSLMHPAESMEVERRRVPFTTVIRYRPYILYLFIWLVFCIIESVASSSLEQTIYFILIVIVGSFASLTSGIFSDRIGRKRTLLYVLITLGVIYAIKGLFPTSLVVEYLFVAFRGIAWGTFLVMFISVLWGDLSPPRKQKEKYYALGILPFFLFTLFRLILVQYAQLVSDATLYSLTSFFLFLAVLPLLYAPETLPQQKIALRRLRKYVETAKKVREQQ